MEGMIITHKGLEDVSKLEVKELIGQAAKTEETAAIFPVKKIEELAKLCYLSRASKRVILYLGSFDVKGFESTAKNIQKLLEKTDFRQNSFKDIIKKSHRCECERIGSHEFNSVDIEEEAGKNLKKIVGLKTDYKSPFFVLYVYIYNDKGYIGIDFCNKDLSKRKYKIYNYGGEIKGTIAYSLLRIAGFKKGQFIIDPFCGTGTIPIEACLFQNQKSPHFFDKEFIFTNYVKFDFEKFDKKISNEAKTIFGTDSRQKNISTTKKNAKIAGAAFQVSRIDIEWLDTRFGNESVDLIIGKPIIPSKHIAESIAHKSYKDLFYSAKFVLKKTGKIALLAQKSELIIKTSENYGFKLAKKIAVHSGQAEYDLTVFEKS